MPSSSSSYPSSSSPSSSCKLCQKYRGKTLVHGSEGCKLGESTKCLNCYQYGHLSVDCAEPRQYQRPQTLEELIPIDLRLRLGITTSTRIAYADPKVKPSELPEINTIEVPEGFSELSEFVRTHGIKVEGKVTKASEKALLKAIRTWATARGYRIYQTARVPLISHGLVDGEDTEASA
jgi:hypothetical protein